MWPVPGGGGLGPGCGASPLGGGFPTSVGGMQPGGGGAVGLSHMPPFGGGGGGPVPTMPGMPPMTAMPPMVGMGGVQLGFPGMAAPGVVSGTSPSQPLSPQCGGGDVSADSDHFNAAGMEALKHMQAQAQMLQIQHGGGGLQKAADKGDGSRLHLGLAMRTPPQAAAPLQSPDEMRVMGAEIQSLCERFNLDERIRMRLTDQISRRPQTFRDDIKSLFEVLTTARNPPGLLSIKLNEMEAGTFVARSFSTGAGSTGPEFCGDFRRGVCTRGDRCKYSHGMPPGMSAGSGATGGTSVSELPAQRSIGNAAASAGGTGATAAAGSGWVDRKKLELGSTSRGGGMTAERRRELFDKSSTSPPPAKDRKKSQRSRSRPKEKEKERAKSRSRQREPSRSGSPRRRGRAATSRSRSRKKARSRSRSGHAKRSRSRRRSRSRDRRRRSRSRSSGSHSRSSGRREAAAAAAASAAASKAESPSKDGKKQEKGKDAKDAENGKDRKDAKDSKDKKKRKEIEEEKVGKDDVRDDRKVKNDAKKETKDNKKDKKEDRKVQKERSRSRDSGDAGGQGKDKKDEKKQRKDRSVSRSRGRRGGSRKKAKAKEKEKEKGKLKEKEKEKDKKKKKPKASSSSSRSGARKGGADSDAEAVPSAGAASATAAAAAAIHAAATSAASKVDGGGSGTDAAAQTDLRPDQTMVASVSAAVFAPQATPSANASPNLVASTIVSSGDAIAVGWMAIGAFCTLCHLPTREEHDGVICRRTRPVTGQVVGCGGGVCWNCMASTTRQTIGDVRTSKEEFQAMEEDGQAWWMHESCMDKSDKVDYYGSEQEYSRAKQQAAEAAKEMASETKAMMAQAQATRAFRQRQTQEVSSMSPFQLIEFLSAKGVDHDGHMDHHELLRRALDYVEKAPSPLQAGPAWMPKDAACRLCKKTVTREFGGVICRRLRLNGAVGGCGANICWRCMKRCSKEEIGAVRCTQEEFEGLGIAAWWMHERCMTPQDRAEYYGEELSDSAQAANGGANCQDLGAVAAVAALGAGAPIAGTGLPGSSTMGVPVAVPPPTAMPAAMPALGGALPAGMPGAMAGGLGGADLGGGLSSNPIGTLPTGLPALPGAVGGMAPGLAGGLPGGLHMGLGGAMASDLSGGATLAALGVPGVPGVQAPVPSIGGFFGDAGTVAAVGGNVAAVGGEGISPNVGAPAVDFYNIQQPLMPAAAF